MFSLSTLKVGSAVNGQQRRSRRELPMAGVAAGKRRGGEGGGGMRREMEEGKDERVEEKGREES